MGDPDEVAHFRWRLIRGVELEQGEHPYADEAYRFAVGQSVETARREAIRCELPDPAELAAENA